MIRTDSPTVVIGAGVFGLTIALRLARAGHAVRIVDDASAGTPNASAVAAGMLAPVGETLAENGDASHLRRLLAARDLWPELAASVPGLDVDRTGADLLSPDAPALAGIIRRLRAWGIDFHRLPAPRLGVHVVDDWRLDPATALPALRAALNRLGVAIEGEAVSASPHGFLIRGEPLRAGLVVVAAGHAAARLAQAAPELAVLRPIKGQLLAFEPGAPSGPSQRGEGIYLAPQPSGARAGATMQPDRGDIEIDPAVVLAQHASALRLDPELSGLAHRGEAGVRAATPDGWPLVGPSVTPGVFLAVGARRNGWLLAPLVSRMILDEVTGAAPHPLAGAFHPGRFTR